MGRTVPEGPVNHGQKKDWNRGKGKFRREWKNRGDDKKKTDTDNSKKKSQNNHLNEKIEPRKRVPVGERLKEADVGITEYIADLKGFSGVIKHRYSDFQVNEIDLSGNLVKLTTQVIPKEESPKIEVERHELIPEDIWNKLKEWSTEKNNASKDTDTAELEITNLDKDIRRKMHKCVSDAFNGNIVSNTIEKDEKKFMSFFKRTATSKIRDKRRARNSGGEYLHFVVHKRNMDTTETVNTFNRMLNLRPSSLKFAGTKDRRAITSQLMCLRLGDPHRLASMSRKIRNVSLGNYKYSPDCLHLGDLKGNQFRVALRNVTTSDEEINSSLASLKTTGFINYFGLQRFGTHVSVPTHEIGKALLQSNWKKAVEMILQPRENDSDSKEMIETRKEWWESRDASKALNKIGKHKFSIEGTLLRGLVKHGSNDYVNALNELPRNTQMLYVHAYQSWVWNRIASRRIKEFGLKPMKGDLVALKEAKIGSSEVECSGKTKSEELLNEQGNEKTECEDDVDAEVNDRGKLKVRCIEENDLPEVKIEDILLPTPGFDVIYPENVLKDWFAEILQEDGLTSEELKNSVKQYSVSGSYRSLINHAENLSWKILHYNDLNEDLIQSDFLEMLGKKDFEDQPGGKFKAVVVTLSLPPSSYATMCLREAMRIETSASCQSEMSAEATNSILDSKENEDLINKQSAEEEIENKMDLSASDGKTDKEDDISQDKDNTQKSAKRKEADEPEESSSSDSKKMKTDCP